MSIVGAALRGFGKALGRGSKNKAKSKFEARRKTLRGASAKNKLDQDVKKTVKNVKKASERAEKFSKTLMKQNYSDSAVNKNLTASYKKMMKKD
jgi:hypothetical protein